MEDPFLVELQSRREAKYKWDTQESGTQMLPGAGGERIYKPNIFWNIFSDHSNHK